MSKDTAERTLRVLNGFDPSVFPCPPSVTYAMIDALQRGWIRLQPDGALWTRAAGFDLTDRGRRAVAAWRRRQKKAAT